MAKRFIETIYSAPAETNPSSHVRRLLIEESHGRYDFAPRWAITVLPFLTATLLEVTVLELYNLSWSALDDKALITIMSGFQKVRRLEIFHGVFNTSEQMQHLLTAFPSLTVLSISNTHWGMETPTIPLPTTLQALSISACHASHFEQLLSMKRHPHLHTLNFDSIYPEYTPAIGRLLNVTGSGLERLDLNSLVSVNDAEAHINLACCVNLRFIAMNFSRVDNWTPEKMNWLCTLLSQIISPHMIEVYFRIQLKIASDLYMIDWARLERILTNPQWANLQKVKISFYNPDVISEAAEIFRASLPLLASGGSGIVWVEGVFLRAIKC